MYKNVLKAATPGSRSAASRKAWLSRQRALTSAAPSLASRLANPDGGFTYSPTTDSEPKTGYAVSPYPQHSFAKKASEMTAQDVMDYIISKREVLSDPEAHIGAWHDPATGTVYMDVSVVVKTPKQARDLSLKHDQIAYFDISKGSSVTVNQNATSGGVAKGDLTKNELVLMNGPGALTVDGMDRIYKALTGKAFTPSERAQAQAKLTAPPKR